MTTRMNGTAPHHGQNGVKPVKPFFSNTISYSYEDMAETLAFLRERTKCKPVVGIICGSGIGSLAERVEEPEAFHYKDIPNFPISTVAGHLGRLVFGKLGGKAVVCMQGRFHAYEGYSMSKVTYGVRIMEKLGIRVMLVTNASGGLTPTYHVGDVMIMKDHINLPGLAGINPLVGIHDERFGARFTALSDAYDKNLRNIMKIAAKKLSFDFIQEGVYVMQVGPCYETVTECRMMKIMGADVTGMSSVPEVIVARQAGIKCVGLSLVTNMCVMEYDSDLLANHEEVMEVGQLRSKDMERLIITFLEQLELNGTP